MPSIAVADRLNERSPALKSRLLRSALATAAALAAPWSAHALPTLEGQTVVVSDSGVQCPLSGWYCLPALGSTSTGTVTAAGVESGVMGSSSAAYVDIDPVNSRLWLWIYDASSTVMDWTIHLSFPDLADAGLSSLTSSYAPLKYLTIDATFGDASIDLHLTGSPGYTYGYIATIWDYTLAPIATGGGDTGGGSVPEPGSAALALAALAGGAAVRRRRAAQAG